MVLHHALVILTKKQNQQIESTLAAKTFKRFIAFCASSDPDLVNNLSHGSPKTYQRNQQRQSLQFIMTIQNSKSQRYQPPIAYHKTYKYTTFTAIYRNLKQQIAIKTFSFNLSQMFASDLLTTSWTASCRWRDESNRKLIKCKKVSQSSNFRDCQITFQHFSTSTKDKCKKVSWGPDFRYWQITCQQSVFSPDLSKNTFLEYNI